MQGLPLFLAGQTRGCAGQQNLKGVAGFHDAGEVARVNVCNDDAHTGPDRDETLPAQPLQGLPDRGSSHAEFRGQAVFGHGLTRLELQRDDVLFKPPIGRLGKARRLVCHVAHSAPQGVFRLGKQGIQRVQLPDVFLIYQMLTKGKGARSLSLNVVPFLEVIPCGRVFSRL